MPDKPQAASPIFQITSKAPPFLIVHGDADKLVPPEQSIDFNKALQKAGVDSHLFLIKGQGHGANSEEAVNLDIDFLNKNLN